MHFVKMFGTSSVYVQRAYKTPYEMTSFLEIWVRFHPHETPKPFFSYEAPKVPELCLLTDLVTFVSPQKPSESIGIFQVINDDAFILPEKDHQTHGFLPTLAGLGFLSLSLKHQGSLYKLPIFGGTKLDANLW